MVGLAQTSGDIEYLDKADLFGKPVLKWSDADIETALSIYRDCLARAPTLPGYHPVNTVQTFERELRDIIDVARNVNVAKKGTSTAQN